MKNNNRTSYWGKAKNGEHFRFPFWEHMRLQRLRAVCAFPLPCFLISLGSKGLAPYNLNLPSFSVALDVLSGVRPEGVDRRSDSIVSPAVLSGNGGSIFRLSALEDAPTRRLWIWRFRNHHGRPFTAPVIDINLHEKYFSLLYYEIALRSAGGSSRRAGIETIAAIFTGA